MSRCHVCGSIETKEEYVNEVFQINNKPVLVEHIPAIFKGHWYSNYHAPFLFVPLDSNNDIASFTVGNLELLKPVNFCTKENLR